MLDISGPDFFPRVVLPLKLVLGHDGAVNFVGWIG